MTAASVGKVAVIGGGVAGLTAAGELARRGARVVVWDKGAGPGGRTSSRRRGGFEFDHGAQYFTAREAGLRSRLGLWLDEGTIARWSPRLRVVEEGAERFGDGGTERYVGVPRMSALAHRLTSGLDVRTGVRVAHVAPVAGGGWALQRESGDRLDRADVVLVTTPPVQARELLDHGPALRDRAAAAALLPCWAVMLGFASPLRAGFDAAFLNGDVLSWAARNSSKPGRAGGEAWVLHASAAWSDANLERPAKDVVHELENELERMLGFRLRPVHRDAHRWRYAIPASPLPERSVYDPELRLGLGGDWCGGSRIEAAFASGLELASRVLAGSDRSRGHHGA